MLNQTNYNVDPNELGTWEIRDKDYKLLTRTSGGLTAAHKMCENYRKNTGYTDTLVICRPGMHD